MNFSEIANSRQSCRNYDPEKIVEDEKLQKILDSARLSPSACNSQPYHITVCKGYYAKKLAETTKGAGLNKFTDNVPIFLVLSEMPYNTTSKIGSIVKGNDYRSIDIGILSAYITAEAAAQGLGSCILGWFDNKKIKKLCALSGDCRLIIAIGYPAEGDKLRKKIRKNKDGLVTVLG